MCLNVFLISPSVKVQYCGKLFIPVILKNGESLLTSDNYRTIGYF